MKTIGTSESGAIFSDCMKYRTRLWRSWDPSLPRALFVLCNPSSADETNNDPTIERQQRRVMAWGRATLFENQVVAATGFGSIEVVNAFAFRSTSPERLYAGDVEPVGPDNDPAILNAATATHGGKGLVICGWGSHAKDVPTRTLTSRHAFLCDFFKRHKIPVSAFKLNGDSTPCHPLYLSYELKPRRWVDGELREEVV